MAQCFENQASNTTAVQLTVSDRTSALLQRVNEANDRLESILSRLRGSHPSPVACGKEPPQQAPNLDLVLTRLENMLGETEGHILEINRTI